tara:strand:- start:80 stop:826 length:747 start_codon:yes stop_codon:yes gene_type:complete
MKKKPKISIIIPFFKKRKFFKETINSILNQSFKNYEIIIIYDDENKSDLNYIRNYIQNYKNIKIFANKKNLGVGLSRNIGIKKSKGEYLAFCDSDDVWKKNKLKEHLKFMIKNNLDFSFTSYNIIDEEGKIIKSRRIKKKINYKILLTHCYIGLSTVLIKKRIVKNVKFTDMKTKEDYLLWLNLLKKNNKIKGFDKILSSWRKTRNSLSSSVLQKLLDGFRLYNRELKYNVFKSFFYLIRLSFNSLIK